MNIKLYKLIFLLSTIFILTSCGGGTTEWGIDQESGKQIPVCSGNQDTTINAIKVYAKQEIEQLRNNTVIRIWHYQNSDKLVCTVQGKAVVYDVK